MMKVHVKSIVLGVVIGILTTLVLTNKVGFPVETANAGNNRDIEMSLRNVMGSCINNGVGQYFSC